MWLFICYFEVQLFSSTVQLLMFGSSSNIAIEKFQVLIVFWKKLSDFRLKDSTVERWFSGYDKYFPGNLSQQRR